MTARRYTETRIISSKRGRCNVEVKRTCPAFTFIQVFHRLCKGFQNRHVDEEAANRASDHSTRGDHQLLPGFHQVFPERHLPLGFDLRPPLRTRKTWL